MLEQAISISSVYWLHSCAGFLSAHDSCHAHWGDLTGCVTGVSAQHWSAERRLGRTLHGCAVPLVLPLRVTRPEEGAGNPAAAARLVRALQGCLVPAVDQEPT